MENMQSSLQQGVSSIKKGIERGKAKLQTSQEVMALRGQVNQNQQKRAAHILTLGELAYRKIRDRELDDEKMNSIVDEIVDLDKEVFSSLKAIDEKIKEEKGIKCECGASLTADTKFCMNCGKSVHGTSIKESVEELVICKRCETEVKASSKYCNCCGGRMC